MLSEEDILFEQMMKLAKQLPTKQWTKLKKAVEEKEAIPVQNSDLVALQLSAPTYSKKQLDEVAKTRKAINQGRTK